MTQAKLEKSFVDGHAEADVLSLSPASLYSWSKLSVPVIIPSAVSTIVYRETIDMIQH